MLQYIDLFVYSFEWFSVVLPYVDAVEGEPDPFQQLALQLEPDFCTPKKADKSYKTKLNIPALCLNK